MNRQEAEDKAAKALKLLNEERQSFDWLSDVRCVLDAISYDTLLAQVERYRAAVVGALHDERIGLQHHYPVDQEGAIVCADCGDWWKLCPVRALRSATITDEPPTAALAPTQAEEQWIDKLEDFQTPSEYIEVRQLLVAVVRAAEAAADEVDTFCLYDMPHEGDYRELRQVAHDNLRAALTQLRKAVED